MKLLSRGTDLLHNTIYNVLDGGFFGFGFGFASFSTVLPLFVSNLTDSAVLIGLVPAIHTMGWQLPQLWIAQKISRMARFKPAVLIATTQERLPYLGLAIVAWLLPSIGAKLGLALTFFLLVWQGLGAGITANPWQNMIAKVIPANVRATFFGLQSGAANLLASLGAIAAGLILERWTTSSGFALCFLAAFVMMIISFVCLMQTREEKRPHEELTAYQVPLYEQAKAILRADANFRLFLVSRLLTQFSFMGLAFYMVYAVKKLGMSEADAGVLTSILMLSQVIANPILGRMADLWSRKSVLEVGAIAIVMSAIFAWLAKSFIWFLPVVILAGIANTAYWTIGLALTLEFGSENERPTYVGLANTLVVPGTIVAPLLGGWLADQWGFESTFIVAAAIGVVTVVILHWVRDPVVKSYDVVEEVA